MNNYMENTEYIKEYLDADDWHYETREFADEHRVVFSGGIGGFKGLYGSFRFLVIVGDEEAQYLPRMANCIFARSTCAMVRLSASEKGMRIGISGVGPLEMCNF